MTRIWAGLLLEDSSGAELPETVCALIPGSHEPDGHPVCLAGRPVGTGSRDGGRTGGCIRWKNTPAIQVAFAGQRRGADPASRKARPCSPRLQVRPAGHGDRVAGYVMTGPAVGCGSDGELGGALGRQGRAGLGQQDALGRAGQQFDVRRRRGWSLRSRWRWPGRRGSLRASPSATSWRRFRSRTFSGRPTPAGG